MNKKLIEVALPLEAINAASAREKSIRQGHPSSLHLWWARRPLAAARAVIFAQMVDDPSAHPIKFPTNEAQENERQRLFRLIEKMVLWENTTNQEVLSQARAEIWNSWKTSCEENKHHPQASELFNPEELPSFHDPFAGGGALPLEAQRLGLVSYASDLNPVAVLINKAMIEVPPKFAGCPPVNPNSRKQKGIVSGGWKGSQGLAADVRYYGQWMRDEAEKKIGHLYPKIEITSEMTTERSDLKKYEGQKLNVIAWLWARTVKSPNPAFNDVQVPLVSSYMISTKPGKEVYVEPIINESGYCFSVKVGKPRDMETVEKGTKSGGSHTSFLCLMSGTPITFDYIRSEGMAGRIGTRLMAIVVDGNPGRIYLSPTDEMEILGKKSTSTWKPDSPLHGKCRVNVSLYGFETFGDLFTPRQLTSLTTFSDLIIEVRKMVEIDALANGMSSEGRNLSVGGTGSRAYADAVAMYLAFVLSKQADLANNLCRWEPIAQCPRQLFGRQAIPMVWDFSEGNPLGNNSGAWEVLVDGVSKALAKSFDNTTDKSIGMAYQADAISQNFSLNKIISTDPPYYDNIGYADLSDFFYVWLRRSLKPIFPDLFSTLSAPKNEELVATSYRHNSKEEAEAFFLEGMIQAMNRLKEQMHPNYPVTIYYAFKQTETMNSGTVSTGWETFLEAVIKAGFTITGTWPIRTENSGRMIGHGANALASSIILVCRPKNADASIVTRRELLTTLKSELPQALAYLQHSNIAPVDLAQTAIGPGMAIFTRFAKVIDAEGKDVTVCEALSLINQTLDEMLAEQEGDFDADTRWALSWFEQYGFEQGEFGIAETLSKAKNTSVHGMVEAGILTSKGGKVRLLKPEELPGDWDPKNDARLTVWEMVHHLARILQTSGEAVTAELVTKLGNKADIARELAYRLYTICERNKRAKEAMVYNSLVQSWPEILRLAKGEPTLIKGQTQLFEEE